MSIPVTTNPTDFPYYVDGYAAVPGDRYDAFWGLDPALAALLLLLLIAALVYAGFEGGRWVNDGARDRGRGLEDLYDDILKAAVAARTAGSGELRTRAEELRDVIRRRLGPVLKIGGDINGKLKPLDEAIKGQVPHAAPQPPAGSHTTPQHQPPQSGGQGPAGQPTGDGAPANLTINQVHIGGVTVPAAPGAPGGGPVPPSTAPNPPPTPPMRTMTLDEQVAALNAAVLDFHDYWRRKSERLADLKAARDALQPKPRKPDDDRSASGKGPKGGLSGSRSSHG